MFLLVFQKSPSRMSRGQGEMPIRARGRGLESGGESDGGKERDPRGAPVIAIGREVPLMRTDGCIPHRP